MDRLLLEGMIFFGRHGALAAERDLGARFTVDVELGLDLRVAGQSDSPADTVDYSMVYEMVRGVLEGKPHTLLESVAEEVATRLLAFDHVERATVRVLKRPPVTGEFHAFGAEVTRNR